MKITRNHQKQKEKNWKLWCQWIFIFTNMQNNYMSTDIKCLQNTNKKSNNHLYISKKYPCDYQKSLMAVWVFEDCFSAIYLAGYLDHNISYVIVHVK